VDSQASERIHKQVSGFTRRRSSRKPLASEPEGVDSVPEWMDAGPEGWIWSQRGGFGARGGRFIAREGGFSARGDLTRRRSSRKLPVNERIHKLRQELC
jgi:hypothetical protein